MDNIFPNKNVNSVQEFIQFIEEDTKEWNYDDNYGCPWFRGQSDANKPPIPSVFRKEYNGFQGEFDEFNLTRAFRERSAVLSNTPTRKEIDKWLFLMQHHGLPTRLLDWTESALIALFFAVYKNKETGDRAVWMIHPLELNYPTLREKALPNTWVIKNNTCVNFSAAFGVPEHIVKNEDDLLLSILESKLPIAIPASYCDSRMFAQRSCFTIHGSERDDFETLFIKHELVEKGYFKKYIIPNDKALDIYEKLKIMGITYSSIYPDLDGLAKELGDRFFKKVGNRV